MSILLVGLLISTDVTKSIALFKVGGQSRGYRVGYEIPNLGKVESIEHHRLSLSRNGQIFLMRPGDSVGEDPQEYEYEYELEPDDSETGFDEWPEPIFERPH